MNVQTVRAQNLKKLVKEIGSQAKLASLVGVTAPVISQLTTNHRRIGEKLARKIEVKTNRQPLWLDRCEESAYDVINHRLSLRDLWDQSSEDERADFLCYLAAKR